MRGQSVLGGWAVMGRMYNLLLVAQLEWLAVMRRKYILLAGIDNLLVAELVMPRKSCLL